MLARVLVRLDRFTEADRRGRGGPGRGRRAPPADDPDAPGPSADALVTLAVCDEYGGQPERARRRLDEAIALARRAGNLGVELRAYFAVGLSLLDEGRLRAAGDQFAAGARRAEATGTTWSSYGLDLRVALVVARFLHGDWDAAAAAAELAGESVSATVAARLAAVGLLVAAGRGRFDAVDRRLAELRDTDRADDQVIMFAGQAGAEAALWQGRPGAAARARAGGAGRVARRRDGCPHLGSIMLAALGVAAQADLAAGRRAAARRGGSRPAASWSRWPSGRPPTGCPAAAPSGPRAGLAVPRPGRADPASAAPDPDAWTTVAAAFGYEVGEAPRVRLRAGAGAAGGRAAG